MTTDTVLMCNGVGKRFGKTTALRSVSFSAVSGEFLTIFGHNGAGKSTLLNIIATLMRSYDGEVEVAVMDIHVSCAGYMTITTQHDSEFTGSLVMPQPDCFPSPSTVNGTVTVSGEVELNIREIDLELEEAGCAGSFALEGTLSGDDLTVATTSIPCPEGIEVAVAFSGHR